MNGPQTSVLQSGSKQSGSKQSGSRQSNIPVIPSEARDLCRVSIPDHQFHLPPQLIIKTGYRQHGITSRITHADHYDLLRWHDIDLLVVLAQGGNHIRGCVGYQHAVEYQLQTRKHIGRFTIQPGEIAIREIEILRGVCLGIEIIRIRRDYGLVPFAFVKQQ